MEAYFGYQNNSEDALNLPIGEKNKFSPGDEDIGQPTEFFKGRVANVVTATIAAGSTLRWVLGDTFVDANIATVQCQPAPINCIDKDIKDILARLDNISANMKNIVAKISDRELLTKASSVLKKKARAYTEDASDLYAAQWNGIWSNFPQVIRVCPSCRQIDKSAVIRALNARERMLYRLVKQAAQLLNDVDPNGQQPSPSGLVKVAGKLNSDFSSRSQQLPRFLSDCE